MSVQMYNYFLFAQQHTRFFLGMDKVILWLLIDLQIQFSDRVAAYDFNLLISQHLPEIIIVKTVFISTFSVKEILQIMN